MIDVGDDGDITNLHSLGIYPEARMPNKLSTLVADEAVAGRGSGQGNFHLTVWPDVCTMLL